ncbi:MAG: chitobiase/beta-hexosaminidase C-terminal domain-containing protein, partial [Deltaproteobacteria bacterium]|nr:chitobiase/beta-hexosaminidase C-terminal domain-containing protein [Deltaproteobacteria bacterium]
MTRTRTAVGLLLMLFTFLFAGAGWAIDTTPPTTTASPGGGQYVAAQSVALAVDEPADILYSIDNGATWGIYHTPIPVNGQTTVQYHAIDTSGNIETTKTAAYSIAGGALRAWGSNANGQLGIGANYDVWVPTNVSGLDSVASIAAGWSHTVALKSDGTVWAWGPNWYGQLGNGTTTDSNVPVQVSGLSGVTAIAAGAYYSIALKGDGTVWAWGANWDGELGGGTYVDSYIPVQVSGLASVTAISAGYFHALALRSDGTVWAWGANWYGQLGDGTGVTFNMPVQVFGLADVKAISAGRDHTLALKSDGTAWAWGANWSGQLGNGSSADSYIPVQVTGLSNAVSVAAGGLHSVALIYDGTVLAWGDNSNGQLGDGSGIDSYIPVQVAVLPNAVSVAAGDSHTVALVGPDGMVWAWGYNYYGQLGDGTNNASYLPVPASGLMNAAAAYAGGEHSLAVIIPGSITGTVSYSGGYSGPVSVVADTVPPSDPNFCNPCKAETTLASVGPYTLYLPDGTYYVAAVMKTDPSGVIKPWDPYGVYGAGYYAPSPVWVMNGSNVPSVDVVMADPAAGLNPFYRATYTATAGLVRSSVNGDSIELKVGDSLHQANYVWANCTNGGATMYYSASCYDFPNGCWEGYLSFPPATQAQLPITCDFNVNDAYGTWNYTDTITSVPPYVTNVSPANGQWVVEPVNFSWAGQPGHDYGVEVDDAYGNLLWKVRHISGASVAYSGPPLGWNQQYNFTITMWDAAGNASDYSSTFNYGYDTTPPTLSISPAGGVYATAQKVTLTADEPATIYYATDGTMPCPGCPGTQVYAGSIAVAGSMSIKALAVDTAGNYSVPYSTAYAVTGGGAWAWGWNSFGQLGNGTNIDVNNTPGANGLSGVLSLAGGNVHTIALTSDGTVWAWGVNGSGQLGDGTFNDSLVPVQVSGLTDVVSVATRGWHSIALKSDGTVWAWGANWAGQLGNGTTTDSNIPVQESSLSGVVSAAAGNGYSLALKSDGTVWAWGANPYGELGDGTYNNSYYPVQVAGLGNVASVAAGPYDAVAVKQDGTVWAWGSYNGPTAVQVSGLSGVVSAAVGVEHFLALKPDGTVWAWGYNYYGQFGDGTYNYSSIPVQVTGLSGAVAAAAGDYYSLALKSDGTVWAWGANWAGQLGDGTYANSNIPVQASGLMNAAAIAAGASHSLAVVPQTPSTASGSYSYYMGSLTLNAYASTFTCEGPAQGGNDYYSGVSVTETTLTWYDASGQAATWTRTSGYSYDITGTWLRTDPATGNVFEMTFDNTGAYTLKGYIKQCRMSDLTVAVLSLDPNAWPNGTGTYAVYINDQVTNTGNWAMPSAAALRYYLSTDSVLDANDAQVGERQVDPLC